MFRIFEGQTANTVWCDIANVFCKEDLPVQESRGGSMRELLHSVISISDPRQRWVSSRTPALNLAFALAEVVWILAGRNDSAFLNYFNRQLPKFAGLGSTYHGAYGHRLRSHLGIDQLQRAYDVLSAKPSSRQVVLQIWDGKIDLPTSSGEEASPDIPCNVVSLLKVRSEQLEWMQIMRSNDVQLGLPHNLVQFTTMQEVLAGWLGLGLGDYYHISDSLHLYERDFAQLQKSFPQQGPPNTDLLDLPKDQSDRSFQQLTMAIELIIDERNTAEELRLLFTRSKLLTPFRNMLCVFCAEGARRRRSERIADEIMLSCTNSAYTYLYNRWLERVREIPKL
ncbi:MAG: thymidylate synthase [Halobacteriota archaeon]